MPFADFFYFFIYSNLGSSGCSHVGPLFTDEEQQKKERKKKKCSWRIPALLGLPDTKWYRSWVYFGDFQTSTDSRLDHESTERLPCWFFFNFLFNFFFIAFLSTGPEVLLWQSVFLAQLSLFALICYKRHGRLGVKKQVTYLLSYNRHGWLRAKNQLSVYPVMLRFFVWGSY